MGGWRRRKGSGLKVCGCGGGKVRGVYDHITTGYIAAIRDSLIMDNAQARGACRAELVEFRSRYALTSQGVVLVKLLWWGSRCRVRNHDLVAASL